MSESWVSRLLASLERGASLQDVARSASFAGTLAKLAALLARTGVTPNRLTLLSLVPALVSGLFATFGAFGWATLFLLLSGVFDMLDGPLARSTGTVSRYGALLDSTIDRLTDAVPLLGLTVFFAPAGWMAVVPAFTLLAAYTVSYVRARCEGLKVQLPPMWMRRGDRMVLIALSLLLGLWSPAIALAGIGLVGILSLLAAADALRVARHVIDARVPEARVVTDAPASRDNAA